MFRICRRCQAAARPAALNIAFCTFAVCSDESWGVAAAARYGLQLVSEEMYTMLCVRRSSP